MKSLRSFSAAFLISVSTVLSGYATDIVNDTLLDGNRTDPATYSEQGVDTDLDNNIESRWFGTTLSATPSHLIGTVGAGSSSWSTYFTDTFANSINLANSGDMLRITWVFTPSSINAGNASQGFRMAMVQTPSGSRLVADGTPANALFAGYGIFQNFGPTLARANGDNLDLMERTAVSASDILGTGGNWTKRAGGGTITTEGFLAGTSYTFLFTAQRTALGELQLDASFSGGNIDGDGSLSASFLDTTPTSFTFDTFSLRPSSSTSAAGSFDTTQLRVEFFGTVPEPATLALLLTGVGVAAIVLRRQRRA